VAATESSSSSVEPAAAAWPAALGAAPGALGGGAERSPASALLAEAARASWDRQRTEELLLAAQKLDPSCLSVYRALYKLYAAQRRLPEAEREILSSLRVASELCGVSQEWRSLQASSVDWSDPSGPARFVLWGLKALAFVWLRQGRVREAEALLDKLAELDPIDGAGGSVVRAIASVAAEAASEARRRARALRTS